MDNADLYKESSSLPKRDAEMILKEFSSRFTWSENENILDVGCGPGDVTVEILQAQLPSSASIVGIDVNSKMVESAKNHYSSEKVQFIHLDFSTKNILDTFQEGQFSKIFSFYCFHWIRDLKQAANNIYTLLQPGGEFLIFMVSSSYKGYQIYRTLSKRDEWKDHMKDIDNTIPCFRDSAEACEEIQQVLTSQGLDVVTCEERNYTFPFPNIKKCLRLYESINPFVKGMSEDSVKQYMACFEQLMRQQELIKESASGEILIHYPLIILYGRRHVTAE